jgi:hypothetical protein
VRAIGNLHVLAKMLPIGDCLLLNNSVQAAVNALDSGTFKVRWNACYAIRNIMSVHEGPPPVWKEFVFKALCHAIKTCSNFKVKIGAVGAIGAFKQYTAYARCETDNTIEQCIQAMTFALCNIQQMLSDAKFGEHTYKEQLVAQIKTCAEHFQTIIPSGQMPACFAELQDELANHSDICKVLLGNVDLC